MDMIFHAYCSVPGKEPMAMQVVLPESELINIVTGVVKKHYPNALVNKIQLASFVLPIVREPKNKAAPEPKRGG